MLDGRVTRVARTLIHPAGIVHAALGADGDDRNGFADRVREPGEFAPGASHGQAEGNCGAAGDWSEPGPHRFTTIDGNAFARGTGGTCGAGAGFLGGPGPDENLPPGGLDGPDYLHAAGFSDSAFHVGRNDSDGSLVWTCPGFADHSAGCGTRVER